MRFNSRAIAVVLAILVDPCLAFNPNGVSFQGQKVIRRSTTAARMSTEVDGDLETSEKNSNAELDALTDDIVSKFRFREVKRELELRDLDTSGTFTSMRKRLRLVATEDSEEQGENKSGKEDVRVIGESALNNVSKNHFSRRKRCEIYIFYRGV